ncbi:MAG TPA: hypothetical protein VMZ31_00640 [Phycisphaerae bacterium]|nr:hypothetical protein [Phycisphaerae bacterium]
MTRMVEMAVLVMLLCVSSEAVKTELWVENEPPQLEEGQFENTVSTSLGQVLLDRSAEEVFTGRDDVDYVHALVEGADGALYAGTGPSGLVLKIHDGSVSELFRVPDRENVNVWSLLWTEAGLLAGVDGPEATIYAIDPAGGAEPARWSLAGARYVWAMVQAPDGTAYAATGPEGKLFALQGGVWQVVHDSEDENLLCLAVGKSGTLYAGSDGRGLVVRIDPVSGKSFVLYDAVEDEIGALLVGADGSVYAGTASAEQAKPGRSPEPRPGGKPEAPASVSDERSSPQAAGAASTRPARPVQMGRPPASEVPRGKKVSGNAVYRIDASGFVTEVLRESMMVLSLVKADGQLVVGTGNEGRIYGLRPSQDEVSVLRRLASSHVSSLCLKVDGSIAVGASNPGGVYVMSAGYAPRGTFVSRVLDADRVSRWGQARVWTNRPAGTEVTLALRCGNTAEVVESLWSDWTGELPTADAAAVPLTPARFLQYRLTLTTEDAAVSPVVDKVQIARQADNRPPIVADVRAKPDVKKRPKPAQPAAKQAGDISPQDVWLIEWTATDANGDTLVYDVFFREVDRSGWIRLAEDVAKPPYRWETRSVADGLYQIRVVAKDTPDNPPQTALSAGRVSDTIVVDNSPPEIKDLTTSKVAGGMVHIQADLSDDWTNISRCHYSVDSNEKWTAVLPGDGIFDSQSEQVRFRVGPLDVGDHRLAVRAIDEQDNAEYAVVSVTIGSE